MKAKNTKPLIVVPHRVLVLNKQQTSLLDALIDTEIFAIEEVVHESVRRVNKIYLAELRSLQKYLRGGKL